MFVVALGMGMTGLTLVFYAKDLDATYTEIGLLGVTYVVFNVLLSVPAGRLADRYGRKIPMTVAMFSIAGVFMLYAWHASVLWLLVIRLVQGIPEAPIWVNGQTAIADLSAPEKRGRAMGAFGSSWAGGFALGPLIAGFLYNVIGPGQIFILSGLVALIGAAIMSLQHLPRPKITFEKTNLKGIRIPCLMGLIYLGVLSVVFILFPAYAGPEGALGIPSEYIGMLMALIPMIRALLFVPMGGFVDRFGVRPIILGGFLGMTVASLLIGVVTEYLIFVLAFAILAVAEGAVYPASISMVSEAGGGINRGYMIGIFNAVSMVGWGLFPGIGGAAADIFSNPTVPYFMCAVVAVVALIILWKVLPRR
jgi:MFS family permease